MNCNFLPKAAKECSSLAVFVRWKLGLFVVYLMFNVLWSRVIRLANNLDCDWSTVPWTVHEFVETEKIWRCLVTARSRTQSFFTKNCKIFYIHCRRDVVGDGKKFRDFHHHYQAGTDAVSDLKEEKYSSLNYSLSGWGMDL